MRILHTADWHIGCKTDDYLRLDEQKQICLEIVKIANDKKVDMVVIAGDLYDSFLPSADSEKLVFDTLLKLSNNGNRPVIVVAGNHDEPKRLSNANVFSNLHNIYLVGEMNKISYSQLKNKDVTPVNSGVGYIEFKTKQGEKVVVACMPYPSYYRYKQLKNENSNFNDNVKEWFKPALMGFRDDTINIAVSHLLSYGVDLTNPQLSMYETLSDVTPFVERSNLQSKAHYTALGHIHMPITVDKQNHIYYSGSTINKFYYETEKQNCVLVADIDLKNGVKKVEKVYVSTTQLISQSVGSVEEALAFLSVNKEKLIKLVFEEAEFVSMQDIKKIKNEYKNVITISVEPKAVKEQTVFTKKNLSTKEIFEKFVEQRTGQKPEEELTKLFLEIMGEIVYEAK